jgi:CRP/FNR family cyclic AMP-dependent transcriptional regulator
MPVPADRLQALPLFSTLSQEEREAVGRLFEPRQVSPGTRLTLEGASGYSFFVIEDGTVQVERAGKLLETLGPGDFFGEAAILTGERRNASVTAASDANLFVLFGTEFRVLERDYPDAAEKITQKMLERTADAPQT